MDELTKIDMCIENTNLEISELKKRLDGLYCKLNTLHLMKEEELLKEDFPL